jgi:hypothetical protein
MRNRPTVSGPDLCAIARALCLDRGLLQRGAAETPIVYWRIAQFLTPVDSGGQTWTLPDRHRRTVTLQHINDFR